MSRAGSGSGSELGRGNLLLCRFWSQPGLEDLVGYLSDAGGEESVTLLPGLPPCGPLRPHFPAVSPSSGFCPAEPSHVSLHGRVLV